MRRHVPFTTSLPVGIVAKLNAAATETGMTKSAVLVEAFRLWNRRRKQELLAASYARTRLPDPDAVNAV